MDLENIFYVKSGHLKAVEPLMQKYFDYDSSMFNDEIQHAVENSGINYKKIENGIVKINYQKSFEENETLAFIAPKYPFKDIADNFPKYFDLDNEDKKIRYCDGLVYLCLTYMGYIYFKQVNKYFEPRVVRDKDQNEYILNPSLYDNLDIDYQNVLHGKIYPEILSLYKIILESKKYKYRGDKITIITKDDKIDINTCAWFLDDMEKYFKDRFPDLTLDKINDLLQTTNKAGRKSANPYAMILIWGTYNLLKEHHSHFSNEKAKISKEICEFIIKYLNLIGVEHGFVDTDIKDNLKDMINRGYTPKWNLPWRNVFSEIKEKEPESELEKLNQPSRRYDLSNYNKDII